MTTDAQDHTTWTWFYGFEVIACPLIVQVIDVAGFHNRWRDIEHATRLRCLLFAMRLVSTAVMCLDVTAFGSVMLDVTFGRYALAFGVGLLMVIGDVMRLSVDVGGTYNGTRRRVATHVPLLATAVYITTAYFTGHLFDPLAWMVAFAFLLRCAEALAEVEYMRVFATRPLAPAAGSRRHDVFLIRIPDTSPPAVHAISVPAVA